ncbi:MAG: hypothetical protein ACPGOY_11495 [Rhodospirillaceae bacterium]
MNKITLHAQPYDISASGFFFETAEQYQDRAAACRNDFGQPVEEFEIQFIDGEALDCALAQAWGINQANFPAYLEALDDWDEDRKRRYIIAVGEAATTMNRSPTIQTMTVWISTTWTACAIWRRASLTKGFTVKSPSLCAFISTMTQSPAISAPISAKPKSAGSEWSMRADRSSRAEPPSIEIIARWMALLHGYERALDPPPSALP